MKTYKLFLDDFRTPEMCLEYSTMWMPIDKSIYVKESWIVVKDYDQFVRTVVQKFSEGEFPDLISFDHDLADEHYGTVSKTNFLSLDEYYNSQDREMTGRDCAKWLVQFCIDNDLNLPGYWIHSMNPGGSKNIHQEMQDWYRFNERFKK